MNQKVVMGTGGGPPPSDDDNPLNAVRKLIEPQMDGLYSMYDGDATLMKQFQESLPEEQRIAPIEEDYLKSLENITTFVIEINTDLSDNDHGPSTSGINTTPLSQSQVRENLSRIDILRKRKATALLNKENNTTEELATKKSKTANESFKILSEEKLELVRLQKLSLEMEIEHKQKNI
ncbi:unnamed protein product [Colias eurytheme]|nr:unnamed protein product [Colias eurytheme]